MGFHQFDDEEPIVHSSYSGLDRRFRSLGNDDPVLKDPVPDPLLRLKLYNIKTSAGQKQVMVELTGPPHTGESPGLLDLVVVLDVSGSMRGEKLKMMKDAMGFLIGKLADEDRLAIIQFRETATFAHNPKSFLIAGKYRKELINAVNGLEARGNTNIMAGLQKALDLTGRTTYPGRVSGILLLSDGLQNECDATKLDIGDRQVDTFGFGEGHDAKVLNSIARNSLGGTFNYVRDRGGLVEPFSQPFAGLHHTVVTELKLTVRQEEPDKQDQTKTEGKTKEGMVDAGGYKRTEGKGSNAGSVTVNFGNLYCDEVRTVIVDLCLPAAADETFHVKYSYRLPTSVKRSQGTQYSYAVWLPVRPPSVLPTKPDLQTELARRKHVKLIGDAIKEADKNNLAGAKSKLLEDKNGLAGAKQALAETKQALAKAEKEGPPFDFTKSKKRIKKLERELEELQPLLVDQGGYEKEGRPYALAAETSHLRQRFAARGDMEQKHFRTRAMKEYQDEAKKFATVAAAKFDPEEDER